MWFWILVISIPIIILAILEETIQFLVNRKVFETSERQFSIKEKLRDAKNKFKYKKSHSQ
ncbi:hypothetical protein [Cytobacillus sp. NCCP-133]|uniref:hypothetical protein n=1 Tax=Cytobacillus sp. NCCP-133 TaxID=766848 RepID=UPI002230DE51|nr:hypothetical protein [Cytobacillus sp. NCCP-133]GLB59454.1 hypothetical protein NCCP133_15870 [Cytobacillus sp. NCCP-133]